jgi:hypothetical protein
MAVSGVVAEGTVYPGIGQACRGVEGIARGIGEVEARGGCEDPSVYLTRMGEQRP